MYKSQVTSKIKNLQNQGNTDLAVIPGNLTLLTQTLVVSIDKPIKDNLR